MARGGGGVPAGAWNALVIAIFQPDGVFRKMRSEIPVCSSVPYRTRYRYVPYTTPGWTDTRSRSLASNVSGQFSPAAFS
jgi:hypothetical protein